MLCGDGFVKCFVVLFSGHYIFIVSVLSALNFFS